MVVKFFGNKKGGSGASVDYLLNERQEAKTARTLKGDPQLTKDLIRSIERKQKVCVGVLSFEEKNIAEADKHKIIEDFEKTLLPNMQGRYNVLWVEHTDKGRLELNFVIPKVELETGKALNPYYHKADMHRMEAFEQVHNLQNGWSNPQNPDKARTLDVDTKKLYLAQDYERLDETLHNLVANGSIQNRTQLIEVLEASKINITRKGQDYISVKLPESKKAQRLKGGIYAEQFRSVESLRTISDTAEKTAREYRSRDTQRELSIAIKRLGELTQYKADQLDKQYPKRDIREFRKEPTIKDVVNRELNSSCGVDNSHTSDVVLKAQRDSHSNTDTYQRGRGYDSNQQATSREERLNSSSKQTSNREQEPQRVERSREEERLHGRWEKEMDTNEGNYRQRRQEVGIIRELGVHNERKINSTGATALNRIRREREESQRALQRAEQEREAIHQRVKDSYTELRADHQRNKERLPEDYFRITSIVKAFGEQIERIAQKAKEAYEAITKRVLEREKKEQPKQEQTNTRPRSHGMIMSR